MKVYSNQVHKHNVEIQQGRGNTNWGVYAGQDVNRIGVTMLPGRCTGAQLLLRAEQTKITKPVVLELAPAHLRNKIQLINSIIFLVFLVTSLCFLFSHLFFLFTFLFRTTRHICQWVSMNLCRQQMLLFGESTYC